MMEVNKTCPSAQECTGIVLEESQFVKVLTEIEALI